MTIFFSPNNLSKAKLDFSITNQFRIRIGYTSHGGGGGGGVAPWPTD